MTSRLGKFFRRLVCAWAGHKPQHMGADRVVRHSTGAITYLDKYQCKRCKLAWREAEVYERGSNIPSV